MKFIKINYPRFVIISIFILILGFNHSSFAIDKDTNCVDNNTANCVDVSSNHSGWNTFTEKVGDIFKSIFGIKDKEVETTTPPPSRNLPLAGEENTVPVTPTPPTTTIIQQISQAGLTGNTGPQGIRGLTGPQGPKGDKGEPGRDGTNIDTSGFVPSSFLTKQVERIYDSISKSIKNLSDSLGEEISTKKLTVSGDTNIFGGFNVANGNNLSVNTNTLFVNGINNRVGIGTTTPSFPFHVVGSSVNIVGERYSNDTTGAVFRGSKARGTTTSPTVPLSGDSLLFIDAMGYNGSSFSRGGNILFVADGDFSATNLGTSLLFSTVANGSNYNVERMRISSNGNVGIGTKSPTNIFSLGGTSARTIWMERNTTAATAGQGLTLSSGGAIAGTADLAGGDLNLKSGVSTGTGSSAVRFFTATAATTGTTDRTPTEKMTILGNGNVGIGTTNPNVKLEVAGTIRQNCVTAGALYANASGDIICNPSSITFKNSRNDLIDGLDTLIKLNPVSYKFNENMNMGNRTHLGFISEEVANVLPEFATYDGEGKAYGLDTTAMLAVTVNAVKEMNLKLMNIKDMDKENSFRDSLMVWFGNTKNGIQDFYASVIKSDIVETKEFCVSDNSGKTCLNRTQVDAILNNLGVSQISIPTLTPDTPTCVAPQTLVNNICTDPASTPESVVAPVVEPTQHEINVAAAEKEAEDAQKIIDAQAEVDRLQAEAEAQAAADEASALVVD